MNQTGIKNQHDCPRWTKDYQRLTESDHRIPCMAAFGHCNRKENDPPLVNHFHKSCLEITVMLKGTQVYDVGGKTYKLLGNQIFLTLPNVPHSSAGVPQLQAEFYYFQLDPLNHRKILGLDEESTRYLIERVMRIKGHAFKSNPAMQQLIADAFHNMATKDENLLRCAQAQMVVFLHLLCDIARVSEQIGITPFAANVMEYVREHLTENIPLEELAREFGYSLSFFKAKFRAEAGMTPMYYINSEKIELAKRLLAQGMNVTDTAMRVAFNTSSYFSTVFHRFTSMMPSEYQRAVRKTAE